MQRLFPTQETLELVPICSALSDQDRVVVDFVALGREGGKSWRCNSHLGTWDRHIDFIDL